MESESRKRSRSAPSHIIVSSVEVTKRRKKKTPQVTLQGGKPSSQVISRNELRSARRHLCGHCKRVLSSSHILDVHILEWHDTMFDFLAKKKPMFECLEPECGRKFAVPERRKEHIVKEHDYPEDYLFDRQDFIKAKKAKKKEKSKQKKKAAEALKKQLDGNQPESGDGMMMNQETESSNEKEISRNKIDTTSKHCEISENVTQSKEIEINQCGGNENDSKKSLASELRNTDCEVTEVMNSESDRVEMTDTCGDQEGSINMEEESIENGLHKHQLQRIPKNVCFGHGSQRAFHSGQRKANSRKHWHQQHKSSGETSVNIEQVDMHDLTVALDTVT